MSGPAQIFVGPSDEDVLQHCNAAVHAGVPYVVAQLMGMILLLGLVRHEELDSVTNGFATAGFRALAFEKTRMVLAWTSWVWLDTLGPSCSAGRLLPDGSGLLDLGLDFSQLRRPQLLPTARQL